MHTACTPLSAALTWYSPWEAAQSLLLSHRPTLLNIGHDQKMYTVSVNRGQSVPLDFWIIRVGLTGGFHMPSLLSVCSSVVGICLHVASMWGQIEGHFTLNPINEQTDSAIILLLINCNQQAPHHITKVTKCFSTNLKVSHRHIHLNNFYVNNVWLLITCDVSSYSRSFSDLTFHNTQLYKIR